ncbi:MAG TPA: phosphatase PAP2 family protein [Conexibacter sp.]|nr:phosphatase PAP2 family protein [Conexibacter sp.]
MPRRLRPLPLLVLGLACVAAFALLYALAVRTTHGQRVDDAAVTGRSYSPVAHQAAQAFLTTISVGSLALAIAALVGQALLRRRVALALVGAAVVVGSVVTSEVLKHVILPRPFLYFAGVLNHNTFPSGHTTVAFSVGVAATLVAPPRLRRVVAAGAFLFGSAVGIATVAAGWHRPSDVVGAMLVVIGWAAGIVLAVALVDRSAFDERPGDDDDAWPRPVVATSYVGLALVLLGLGWLAAIAIVAAQHVGALAVTKPNAAFVAACASIAAAAALLLAALMTVMREALPPADADAPSPADALAGVSAPRAQM